MKRTSVLDMRRWEERLGRKDRVVGWDASYVSLESLLLKLNAVFPEVHFICQVLYDYFDKLFMPQ